MNVILLVPILVVLPTVAAANVTGVTLSPASPVVPNTSVTITVTGTNPCGAVEINFGDGEVITYPITALPYSKTRVFPAAGSFTIAVKGQGNCGGQASTILEVAPNPGPRPGDGPGGSPADILCKVLQCAGTMVHAAPATPAPKITKVLGVIQPGGAVLIGGSSFGSAPGRVRMIVEDGSWELLLENLEWFPSGIGGRIPNNPALVKGAQARFVVETSSGAPSNPWPVNWVVEVKLLPREDIRVVSCGSGANSNACNNRKSGGGCPVLDYADWVTTEGQVSKATIGGKHKNCWGAVGDDSGVDTYEITVKNGWVLQEMAFGSAISGEGEGHVVGPGLFPSGSTSWSPSIAWSVSPADEVAYWTYIYIRGPKGVPHK